jgi:hypothetical protein
MYVLTGADTTLSAQAVNIPGSVGVVDVFVVGLAVSDAAGDGASATDSSSHDVSVADYTP